MNRRFLFLWMLILICLQGTIFAEIKEIGTPYIRNFSKQDYNAGRQNWSAGQDGRNFMYFANDEGLLVFDGVQWNLYRMPNHSMVRSVYIDNNGVIYVGAYNDIGMMITEENGKMTFRSIKQLLPEEYRNFDDVWNIFSFNDQIVFQSYYAAFFFDKDSTIKVVDAPERFQNAYCIGKRMIFNDTEKGLCEYKNDHLFPISGCDELRGEDIWSVLSYNEDDELLICTLGKGLYIHDGKGLHKWKTPVDEMLRKDQIFSATILQDEYYAFGTILDGVIIVDREGNLIQHISKKEGLQNNTVLDLYADHTGNLWLCLDNGIDYIIVNSPVTFIQTQESIGAGYTSIIKDGMIYLGTNQGLYVGEWDEKGVNNDLRMIDGTYGQVWYLGIQNGVLICGHNNGTYIIKGTEAKLINNISGGWKYMKLKSHPGYMIGGTYSGIILFKWENNTWKFVRKINGFNESFRVFEEDDDGYIWMSHGFKGIFRVKLNDDLDAVVSSEFYSEKDGLPSNYNLNVYRIKGRIIIASETNGIYEYLKSENRFEPSAYFNQILNPLVIISYLKEDDDGNIWYISDNKAGVFRIQEDFSYQNVKLPFNLLAGKFIKGYESVYSYDRNNVFLGVENGFAHYSPHSYYKSYQEFRAYITEVKANYLDSVFYYGRGPLNNKSDKAEFSFPFKNNDFTFTYTSPAYDNPGNIEYSYRLNGFDRDWSEWSSSYIKEYSNLPEGDFTFTIKARNQLGIESITDSIKFSVRPPWYKSLVAYLTYIVCVLMTGVILFVLIRKRIEASNMQIRLNNQRIYEEKEREYKRQALEAEKEIIRIRNDKLHAEMILRDKELANQAMNLVRKNEFLAHVKEELRKMSKTCHDEKTEEKVNSLISRINKEAGSNRQREVFESAFNEVHENFLARVKAKYPALTPTELKMCAFLRMNLSTKEIAPLLNISVRGVEICRYRIRKKMDLDRDNNLTTLLINL